MKVEALKKILKETVREVFQEELKEVLMEAVRSPKSMVSEAAKPATQPVVSTQTRQDMRANYQQIIGETANQMTQTGYSNKPLQVTTSDTTSPNGRLPEGEVGIDAIMGMMK